MKNYQRKMKECLSLSKNGLDKRCLMYRAIMRLLEKETDDAPASPCVPPSTVPEASQEREDQCQVATDSTFAHITYDGPTKTMYTVLQHGQQLWVRHYSRLVGAVTPIGDLAHGN